MLKLKVVLACGVFGGGFVCIVPAIAQPLETTPEAAKPEAAQASREGSESGLAEILVTAQKRAESLLKVSAAISTIGQRGLDDVGARSIGDATKALPNVSIASQGLSIRGLGVTALSGSGSTVAYHVDGVYQDHVQGFRTSVYDIDRIEVLRGPQGTLYGRNATAGVVNVITTKPSFDFEAKGDISYGNYDALMTRGAINIPLSDNFAMRLSGTYEKSDGTQRLVSGKRVDGRDLLTSRLALRWEPTDRFTIDVNASYVRQRNVVGSYVNNANAIFPNLIVGAPLLGIPGNNDSSNPIVVQMGIPRNRAAGAPGGEIAGLTSPFFNSLMALFKLGGYKSLYPGGDYNFRNRSHIDSISLKTNIRYDVSDAVSLTYIGGYFHEKNKSRNNAALPFVMDYGDLRANDWSHEVDINVETDRLRGVVGFYSFQHATHKATPGSIGIWQPDFPTLIPFGGSAAGLQPTLLPFVESVRNERDKDTTRAIFGQVGYSVSDDLRLIGGARYNIDKISRAIGTISLCPLGSGTDNGARPNEATLIPPLNALKACSTIAAAVPSFYLNRMTPAASKTFKQFSWKLAAEYDLSPDTMLYSSVSTGYKAGGITDASAAGSERFYEPEKNISYEVGLRTRLLDNRLNLSLTGFWTDYKDLQVSIVRNVNGAPKYVFTNAGKSRSRGVELEFAYAPTSNDRITGFVTYLDAKFRQFETPNVFLTAPGDNTPVIIDAAGNRLAGSPEWAFRVAYSHIFDLGSAGTLTPMASTYYQAKSYTYFTNGLQDRAGDYFRSDFNLKYETASKNFFVEGFVNNIENKRVPVVSVPQAGMNFMAYSEPRTYGVRVGFSY
ncbi:putative TonB-dependent receptor [Caenibius tardaugens NBRC 16725]|uniref:Putative TonB-dependent receptor n=1 Tax=Caenibius tardaugens NBRC 16725 TaxID=1219035 RepID=U2YQG5_9SPHN|nr:TonB-dependent receptor [Caenibius tardaugens]AZI35259.1 TonB-dependent receptor [Caenibius tardaugens NBRC 16725]AZI35267.1 TonB-dependent receptor [Caenibius tardaugens NBRC 16725]GAD51210.1 putative TonB-dependent receptor [Caenibius tardaugens NBRC 16725]